MVGDEQAAAMMQAWRQQVEEFADALDRFRQDTVDPRQHTDWFVFDGNNKEFRGWSRLVKAYLGSKYPGGWNILTIIERANG